jgi:hypothetical protein
MYRDRGELEVECMVTCYTVTSYLVFFHEKRVVVVNDLLNKNKLNAFLVH